MKTLLYNGNIYTLDEDNKKFSAILFENGKIVDLGTYEELKSKYTVGIIEEVDLKGNTLLPGFIDTHMHLLYDVVSKKSVDLTACNTLDEVVDLGKDFFSKYPPFRGWVTGRGWDQEKFPDQKFVTKDDLDKISTDVPIIFERVCGHTVAVNSLGLEKVCALAEAQELDRFIDKDKGLLRESATMLRTKTMEDLKIDAIKDLILSGQKELNAAGLTGAHSADFIGGIDEKQWKDIVKAYEELDKEGKLTVRIYEQSMMMNPENIEEYLSTDYNTGYGSDYFKIGPLKLLQDGSLGGRTAAMIEPYSDDPNEKGFTIFSREELYEICEKAYKKNMQIAIHGIGDKAAEEISSIFQELNAKYGGDNRRNGLVHAQFLNEDIVETLKNEKIICYIQPIFIDDDMRLAEQRVGKDRMKYAYAWKTLIDESVPVAGGSDAPVASFNVMAGIHTAVTRQNLNKEPREGWYPEQKISVEEAVRLYTNWAAYASFEEDIKGSLEIGKLADMVVLDKDIFEIDPEEILDTEVIQTYVGGKLVFEK